MGKFEVGQRVKSKLGGLIGTIDHQGNFGGQLYNFLELSDDGDGMPGFKDEELELAPPVPATAPTGEGGGDAPRTDLDAATLASWPRMFRDRAVDPMFAGLYNEAAKNDMLDILDVVATLQAQLATANERVAAAERERDVARETLGLCINADVTGYWSPEEVAKRFFAAYPEK